MPKDQVIKFEAALKVDKYLLVVHGSAEDQETAGSVLATAKATVAAWNHACAGRKALKRGAARQFSAHAKCQSRIKDKGPVMKITTQRARITCPVSWLSDGGRGQNIPIDPCLVERLGGRSIGLIWGARGQRSVALPVEKIEAAQDHGHLVLVD